MSLVAEAVGALFGDAELAGGGGLSFHAISARVRAKGGVLLGWRRAAPEKEPTGGTAAAGRASAGHADARGSPTLNPVEKNSARRWRASDELVVIRRATGEGKTAMGKSRYPLVPSSLIFLKIF